MVRLTPYLILLWSSFSFAQTESVKLEWVNMPGAAAYEIEVSSIGTKGRPLVNRTVDIPVVTIDLPPSSYTYRIRGIAKDGRKGPWSDSQRFEVKIESIALLGPAENVKAEIGSRIRFSWKGSSGYKYRIQILDGKTVVSDSETNDQYFVWVPKVTGQLQWRVSYAAVTHAPWTEPRGVAIQPKPGGPMVKRERPASVWNKTVWAGANLNSYTGDFADTGNSVTAETVSGVYAFELERRHIRFSNFSEPRPSLQVSLRQQSLIKETMILPGLLANYTHLWTLGYFKVGPMAELGYRKSGFFTADAVGQYKFDSLWRSGYGAGVYGEYLFSKFTISSFLKAGTSSGGNSSLAPGGVKPSGVMEFGAGAKFGRWLAQIRFFKEDIEWTSSAGNNRLETNNWTVDLGGEL